MSHQLQLSFIQWMAKGQMVSEYIGNKTKFRRESIKFLNTLAGDLGLDPTTYKVGFNKGGPATSGDAYLHSDKLYISFNADQITAGIRFQHCNGMDDFSGGNYWQDWGMMIQSPGYLSFLKRLIRVSKRSNKGYDEREDPSDNDS
jgi:hypothetical protein